MSTGGSVEQFTAPQCSACVEAWSKSRLYEKMVTINWREVDSFDISVLVSCEYTCSVATLLLYMHAFFCLSISL